MKVLSVDHAGNMYTMFVLVESRFSDMGGLGDVHGVFGIGQINHGGIRLLY